MIFLKANTELKNTFERLIQTMDAPVKWEGTFVVLNNFLILPGAVRSLIFNFDNRKVNTNVIEIPVAEDAIEPIEQNVPVTNVINMILYAFGKWGTISGLKVEKDYAQLNELFTGILRELKIEPGYRNDNFRFYQKGLQITYEDVVQAALEAGKKKEEEEDETEEEKLGLWHNMRWVMGKAAFVKGEISREERIGNNFYPVGYLCPKCRENLHLAVYPVDKEIPVETEEGRVYLARAYACDKCNCFYTARPGKLLSEGDIYLLDFEDDREAYEDYQELLGKHGEKTSNYKFNEYEWERNQKKAEKQEQDREAEEAEEPEIPEELEELTTEEPERLEEKLESGFYAPKESQAKLKEIAAKKRKKISQEKPIQEKQEQDSREKTENGRAEVQQKGETKDRSAAVNTADRGTEKVKEPVKETVVEAASGEIARLQEKYDARLKVADRMSLRQLKELRENIKKEKQLPETMKQGYAEEVNKHIHKYQKQELQKKAEGAKKGNYAQMCRIMEEIEKSDCPKEMKEPILAPLKELRQQKAQAEAEELITHMPAVMDRKRYKLFRDKLEQYKEADIAPYEEKLEAGRTRAERQEIAELVRRAGKTDRAALHRVWQRLQEPDFAKENTQKPLEELYTRLQKLDEAAIDKLCPDIMGMTFAEGQEAYRKIEAGMFLPEIKGNALEMIDKRLTKIKSDENELLVRKLQEELKERVRDTSSLHYYQARKAMLGEWTGEEAKLIECAENTYASEHGKYEYPIVVCDSTKKGTGREGFLLTPDNLFYNSTFNSESIPILNVKSISFSTGLLNKGIYVNQRNGEKTKIPVGIPGKEWEGFTRVLGEFIKYLQEKPESRKVSYLAKEEHEVKCCYRCGYVYKGGEVCPKCGNRANK